jgi:hypothetical protein
VEGSKLCLFSVIMPSKCVSSISSRFHYRRLIFCFLPLAAILESPIFTLIHPFLMLSPLPLILTPGKHLFYPLILYLFKMYIDRPRGVCLSIADMYNML